MLTKNQVRLLDEIVAIEAQEARDAGAIGYMAHIMIQATMPHTDPGDVAAWVRRNGRFSLLMQPGVMVDNENNPKSIGLPYGPLPRLILAWVSTEAVRTKDPIVTLGDSLSAFLRDLGLSPKGGCWGTNSRIREQMRRLFSASITCTHNGEGHWASCGIRIADKAQLLWGPNLPKWQSTVTLGTMFFEELLRRPVPVDMRALKALRRSPMALDLYMWMTYRFSRLNKEKVIPWPELVEQFGADYGRVVDFRIAFKDALKKVCVVYSVANVMPTKKGLLMKPSLPHIRRK